MENASPAAPLAHGPFTLPESTLFLLCESTLFGGLSPAALDALLPCLCPVVRRCARGEVLLRAGENGHAVGIVLSGGIAAVRPVASGARIPMAHMGPGGVFADVLGGAGRPSPVTVTAVEPSELMFLPYDRLLFGPVQEKSCPEAERDMLAAAHARVLQNLVRTVGEKYFALARRVDYLVIHSLREKLAAYLLDEAARAGADTFTLDFTRTHLADYLGCERSALSRELSRMQRDGLLESYRRSIKLLDREALCRLCHS